MARVCICGYGLFVSQREERWSGLLLAGRAGDGRAYARFLTEVASYFRAGIRARVAPADVEDVVQEVLLALHGARHTWRAGQPVTAWLHGIARYKVADHFRRLYRAAEHEIHDEYSYETFAAPITNTPEEKHDLASMLEALTPRQRALLTLTKVEGRTVLETADTLGMTPSAVKVAVHRLLKMLKSRHGEENR